MIDYFDVGVLGAGVIGKTAALAMGKLGKTVCLLDDKDFDFKTQRVYAINENSKNLLKNLDVWQKISSKNAYHKMFIKDFINDTQLEFDASLITQDNLGFIVEDTEMQVALNTNLYEQENINYISNCAIELIKNEGNKLFLYNKDGVIASVGLLIIANGANSKAYTDLNISKTHWSYEQDALVTTVTTSKSHNNIAYQTFYQDNILAFLPLKSQYMSSIVWSLSKERAMQLFNMPEEDFLQELNLAFTELGVCQEITQRQKFPLHMRHTKQYSGDTWLLMGDSAHTIHPLAGMGLNLGLDDLNTWLKLLDTKKPLSQILKAYNRRREYAVWNMVGLMEMLKYGFSSDSSIVKKIRSQGMKFLNSNEFLKRFIVKYAQGIE